MKKISLLILAPFIILTCCKTINLTTSEKKETFSKLSWLEGEWEKQYNYGKIYESWEKTNDSTYEGISKLIFNKGYAPYNNKNAIVMENGEVFFIIKNQINKTTNKPHKLRLVKAGVQEIVFIAENKNEYPQKISYKLEGKKLKTHNSGFDEGKKEKDEHVLLKVN